MADHRLAIPVGAHAARLTIEQRHAEHVLQILEQLRGGGLGHIQDFGGPMDVALIADRREQHELARLESRANEPGRGRGHSQSPLSEHGYLSEYSCVTIAGLSEIDANLMIGRSNAAPLQASGGP